MIGKDLHMKLVDFGLARETLDVANPEICQQYSPQMVTLWYRAPEVLLARPYGLGVDIWSCGCVVAEMLTGKPLFEASSELGMLQTILSSDFQSLQAGKACLDKVSDSDFRDLIESCLLHPETRITANTALTMQCFRTKTT